MEARRCPQHGKSCQVSIISFSLTVVPYTAALLVSQRSTKTEGVCRELLIFVGQEQVKMEKKEKSKKQDMWNFHQTSFFQGI